MKRKDQCPSPIDIMAWLDKENKEEYIAEHLQECSNCRLLADRLQIENKMLKTAFETWPDMPDISLDIRRRIETVSRRLNPLEAAWAYILIISTSLLMLILYKFLFLPYLALTGPWSVSVIKFLSYLTDALIYFQKAVFYLLRVVLTDEPLLPATAVTLLAVLINIYYKRRLSNV